MSGDQDGPAAPDDHPSSSPGDGAGAPIPVVNRDAARAASDAARRKKQVVVAAVVTVAVLLVAGIAFALTRGGDEPPPSTTTTTTSTSTTTTVPAPTGPVAPLTGIVVDEADAAATDRLNRPALVAKVDNAPEAMPQIGLDRADMVIELKVEGISRYMAVVHSQDATRVGPIRSARSSDPDLLAMFVRPLVAWSGGNPTVTRQMNDTPWIQALNPDQAPNAYSRSNAKPKPHNLIVDVPTLYTYADQPPAVPAQIFSYRAVGAQSPGAPSAGFQLFVGKSPSTWVWSAQTGSWLRWANGVRQTVEGGGQIGATNVVVLHTRYEASGADRRSPEAQTLGDGAAWVYSDGRVIEGRWERSDINQPWKLTDADGQPVQLSPGNTWVELPSPDASPTPLDQSAAEGLLAG